MRSQFQFFAVLFFVIFSFSARAADETEILQKAEAARAASQFQESLKFANTVSNPNLIFWKTVLQAEAYLALGQTQNTLALLRNLDAAPWPEADGADDGYTWLYKRALIASRDAKQKTGTSADFENAQLVALYSLDNPSEIPQSTPLSFEQKIAKLKILSKAASYKNIRGLISASEIQNSTLKPQHKCDAWLLLGRALKSFGEEAQTAESALKSVAKSSDCSRDQQAKALFYLGSVAKLKKDTDLRINSYVSLAENYPGHILADDALLELAKYYDTIAPEKSEKYFKKLDDQKTGDMRLDYFFDKGFTAFKAGKFNEALHHFDKMAETTTPINESYVKGLYWRARTLEHLRPGKHQAAAKSVYSDLIKTYPFSFYAVLAAKRLNTTVSVPSLAPLNGTPPDVGADLFALADAFNRHGYSQGARVMVDMALLAHPEIKTTYEEFVAQKFIESQNYKAAIEIAAAHFGSGVYGPVTHEKDPLFAAFYPRVYETQIRTGYRLSGLPLGAIEGIAREESLFEKDATSWVGAKGLMQLMPATARSIQGIITPQSGTADLTDPLNNLLLGSHYLGLMQQRFSGEMPLAIMAYNAGPGNVSKWLKRNSHTDLDVFIEDIPLSETKGYVKRVMRSMNVYGSLYNEDFFKKTRFSMNLR